MRTVGVLILLAGLLAGCSESKIADMSPVISDTQAEETSGQVGGFGQVGHLPEHIYDTPTASYYGSPSTIVIHQESGCGCCGLWGEHLRKNNFSITVKEHDDLSVVRQSLGAANNIQVCHIGEIDGMFIDGHVPAGDIRKMIEAAPYSAAQIKGLRAVRNGEGRALLEIFLIDELGEDLVFSEYEIHPTP